MSTGARVGTCRLVAVTAAIALAGLVAAGRASSGTSAGTATRVAPPAARNARTAAPAPARPAGRAADPWQEARDLADAGRFDQALAVVRAAIAKSGGDFGLRWLEAGITSDANRHRESVALYEKLSADHPERAGELLGDLAAERLSSEDPAGAARDFRRWLRGHPDDRAARQRFALALALSDSLPPALREYDALLAGEPGDTGLSLDRARVLAWMGRHADAVAAYQHVLKRDSTNDAARLGLAMNENWRGRHRVATRELEAIVRDPAADPEALKALAFARDWDGDPTGARVALEDYMHRVPRDQEALDLERRLARERAPSLRFEGGRADDSDELRVLTSGMELRWPVLPATTALLRWRRDNVRDPGGTRDPLRLTAGLGRDWGAAWSAHGEFTHTDWGGEPGAVVGGDIGLVSRPVDHVRLEAGVSREPVLTRRSLALGISLLGWTGTADLALTDAVTLHGDGRVAFYSDENRSEHSAASLRWRAIARRRAELGLSLAAEQLQTRTDPGHGYYAPDLHREWGPGADAQWSPREGCEFGVKSQVGWQGDPGGNAKSFYSLSGRGECGIAGPWTVALEGGRSDSSLQSESGYRRSWWLAAVTLGF